MNDLPPPPSLVNKLESIFKGALDDVKATLAAVAAAQRVPATKNSNSPTPTPTAAIEVFRRSDPTWALEALLKETTMIKKIGEDGWLLNTKEMSVEDVLKELSLVDLEASERELEETFTTLLGHAPATSSELSPFGQWCWTEGLLLRILSENVEIAGCAFANHWMSREWVQATGWDRVVELAEIVVRAPEADKVLEERSIRQLKYFIRGAEFEVSKPMIENSWKCFSPEDCEMSELVKSLPARSYFGVAAEQERNNMEHDVIQMIGGLLPFDVSLQLTTRASMRVVVGWRGWAMETVVGGFDEGIPGEGYVYSKWKHSDDGPDWLAEDYWSWIKESGPKAQNMSLRAEVWAGDSGAVIVQHRLNASRPVQGSAYQRAKVYEWGPVFILSPDMEGNVRTRIIDCQERFVHFPLSNGNHALGTFVNRKSGAAIAYDVVLREYSPSDPLTALSTRTGAVQMPRPDEQFRFTNRGDNLEPLLKPTPSRTAPEITFGAVGVKLANIAKLELSSVVDFTPQPLLSDFKLPAEWMRLETRKGVRLVSLRAVDTASLWQLWRKNDPVQLVPVVYEFTKQALHPDVRAEFFRTVGTMGVDVVREQITVSFHSDPLTTMEVCSVLPEAILELLGAQWVLDQVLRVTWERTVLGCISGLDPSTHKREPFEKAWLALQMTPGLVRPPDDAVDVVSRIHEEVTQVPVPKMAKWYELWSFWADAGPVIETASTKLLPIKTSFLEAAEMRSKGRLALSVFNSWFVAKMQDFLSVPVDYRTSWDWFRYGRMSKGATRQAGDELEHTVCYDLVGNDKFDLASMASLDIAWDQVAAEGVVLAQVTNSVILPASEKPKVVAGIFKAWRETRFPEVKADIERVIARRLWKTGAITVEAVEGARALGLTEAEERLVRRLA